MSEPNYAGFWRRCVASLLDNLVICEWRWGQTIGKNATGIEVRSLDGAERLTYAQASIRNLLRIVDFRAPRAATTEPVAPPPNGSRSRAPSHNA